MQSVKPGDRVVPFMLPYVSKGQGTWQELVVVNEQDVVVGFAERDLNSGTHGLIVSHHLNLKKAPDSLPDEPLAQMMVNPTTVLGMLNELAIPKGEFLAQNAAGSVSHLACQTPWH